MGFTERFIEKSLKFFSRTSNYAYFYRALKTISFSIFLILVHSGALRAQSDNCLTAVSITECVITSSNNNGSSLGADDTYPASEICSTIKEKSVWFTFTASQSGPYTLTISNQFCSGSTFLKGGVFTGSCGSLTAVNCDANSSSFTVGFNAVATQVYFIVIDGVTGSDCGFDALICPGCNVSASFVPSAITGPYPLSVNFTNTGVGGLYHHWEFGTNLQNFDGTNSTFVYEEPGTFIVSLISDNGFCTDTTQDTIVVTGTSALEIPNIFTPNHDEINDVYYVKCYGIDTIDVQVFNRWGELIGGYSGNNGHWDGYSIVAGLPVATGTYFVYVKAIGIDGTVFDEKKVIHLFR